MRKLLFLSFLFGYSWIKLSSVEARASDFYFTDYGIHLPEWVWASLIGGITFLMLKLLIKGWDKRISGLEEWRKEITEQRGGIPLSSDIAERCEKRLTLCDARYQKFRDCIYTEIDETEKRIIGLVDDHLNSMQKLTDEKMKNIEKMFELIMKQKK